MSNLSPKRIGPPSLTDPDQPKPTGEWTARKAPAGYIAAIYCGNTEIYRQSLGALEDLERISDAHNAALAAVRDEYEVLAWSLGVRKDQPKILQQLRKQLAAETRLLDWAISNPEQFNDINMADASERRHVAIKRVRAALAKIGEK